MTRDEFLFSLRKGLVGLSERETNEILADYAAHFAEGESAGRKEAEVAAALGDPARLAKELRAEAGFRRWQDRRSARNFFGAIFAFVGLATVDLVFLLPVLFVTTILLFCFGIVFIAFALAGIVSVVTLLDWEDIRSLSAGVARFFDGAGQLSLGIGGGALLLVLSDALVRGLGRYARLHYRLLTPENGAA